MLSKTNNGTIAEKFADGIFSKMGYSTKIQRESDYGIDFLCTNGKLYGESMYPTTSYTVQLKSNFKPIAYDIAKTERYKWLINNNLPFFFCVYNEQTIELCFYSTSMINDLIIRKYDAVEKLKFVFTEPDGQPETIWLHEVLQSEEKEYTIYCGKPFLKIKATDNNLEDYKEIIEKVIKVENQNIVYRNIGLSFFYWLHQYTTNDKNIIFGIVDYSDENIFDSDSLLSNAGQIIISLCNSFKHNKNDEVFGYFKKIVDKIPFNEKNKPSLKMLKFRDENGNII